MKLIILKDYQSLSLCAADFIQQQLAAKPNLVLALPTGATPLGLYAELVRRAQKKQIDFSRATFFQPDEYVGLAQNNKNSFAFYLKKNFFAQLPIFPTKVNFFSGAAKDLAKVCLDYEKAIAQAGGLDVAILGIGQNGHIAFNEPGSALASRARVIDLTMETRRANSTAFGKTSAVPHRAVTLGLVDIMSAKKILLLVSGEQKAQALAKAVKGKVSPQVPASVLQSHPRVVIMADRLASSLINS